jgi:glycosyltransferase involved in cell wall biosynthesis
MISRKAIDDHQAQYKSIGVPAYFRERITYIINGIALPVQSPVRDVSRKIITVLYAGRATTEKRVYLVARLAIECRKMGLPVRFEFMGDIREKLPRELQDSGHFHGMVTDLHVIRTIYEQADLLIITSSEEGFPMVIMEAMSMGCAILATPVGDIPAHIRHGQNGYLFTAVQDEQKIIAEGLQYLQDYLAQPETRLLMARSNQAYAKAHFGLDQFRSAWQNVLETQNPITQP